MEFLGERWSQLSSSSSRQLASRFVPFAGLEQGKVPPGCRVTDAPSMTLASLALGANPFSWKRAFPLVVIIMLLLL